jgi:membrane fusion protein, multidrug efflux system
VASGAHAEARLALNNARLHRQEALLAAAARRHRRPERPLEARVRAAEAGLELARENLGYTRIVAPAYGMTGQRLVRSWR